MSRLVEVVDIIQNVHGLEIEDSAVPIVGIGTIIKRDMKIQKSVVRIEKELEGNGQIPK